jgi:hypothetical protein
MITAWNAAENDRENHQCGILPFKDEGAKGPAQGNRTIKSLPGEKAPGEKDATTPSVFGGRRGIVGAFGGIGGLRWGGWVTNSPPLEGCPKGGVVGLRIPLPWRGARRAGWLGSSPTRRGVSYFSSTTPSAFGGHPSRGGEFLTPSPPAPLPQAGEGRVWGIGGLWRGGWVTISPFLEGNL